MANKKWPRLPEETATQILENIFMTNKKPLNTVPLSTLTAYSNYRKERFALQRTVIIIILTLFALLPLLFLSGDFALETTYAHQDINPKYQITPKTLMPVRHLNAKIGGESQHVYEGEEGEYIIQPTRQGQMDITMTLINYQKITKTVMVDRVDYERPQLDQSRKTSGNVMLYFTDDLSGVDSSNISVLTSDGQSLSYQYDTNFNCLILPNVKEPLTILVPDFCGNTQELLLSIQ